MSLIQSIYQIDSVSEHLVDEARLTLGSYEVTCLTELDLDAMDAEIYIHVGDACGRHEKLFPALNVFEKAFKLYPENKTIVERFQEAKEKWESGDQSKDV